MTHKRLVANAAQLRSASQRMTRRRLSRIGTPQHMSHEPLLPISRNHWSGENRPFTRTAVPFIDSTAEQLAVGKWCNSGSCASAAFIRRSRGVSNCPATGLDAWPCRSRRRAQRRRHAQRASLSTYLLFYHSVPKACRCRCRSTTCEISAPPFMRKSPPFMRKSPPFLRCLPPFLRNLPPQLRTAPPHLRNIRSNSGSI
jgi:hypothetical protein